MTSMASARAAPLRWTRSVADGVQVFVKDVGSGMLEVSHNLLALVGLVVVVAATFLSGQPEMRVAIERQAFGWLQDRYESRQPAAEALAQAVAEPAAVERATAVDPASLSRQQGLVAQWLSRRYRVAPEPVARLVQEAWAIGGKAGLEPHLILAIMAIESSFNPFAQSPVGAQGLMQVMTRVHDDKFEAFGGTFAAFDPVANLRVGVQILKDCITKAGSLEGGLRFYVGAANLPDDGGYAARVLAERDHLKRVAKGESVPFNAPITVATVTTPMSAETAVSPTRGGPAGAVATSSVAPAAHPFEPASLLPPGAAAAVPTAVPAPTAAPATAPASSAPAEPTPTPARVAGL
jgi:soluble lytic murein transglycosylase-like protein